MTPEEVEHQKSIEFYAAGVNAWYNTSLEHDKSVFALSAGGIGLLITLLTTIGLTSSLLLHLYITAILCFLVSLCSVLVIFRRNRTHIEQVLVAKGVTSDSFLKNLDLVAMLAFGAGAVLTAAIGISAAVSSFESKAKAMAIENKVQSSVRARTGDSFNGVTNLQPTTEFTKSFNGVGKLQPQAVASSPASAPAPVTPASAPVAAPASSGSSEQSAKP